MLNDPVNQELAKEILILDKNKKVEDNAAGIGGVRYFNGEPGKIQPTRWFRKIFYNDFGNLFLLCGDCNTDKSSQNPIEWLKKQDFFKEEFYDQVIGKIHPGLILDKVGGEKAGSFVHKGKEIEFYKSGIGIGRYMRQWYSKNRSEIKIVLNDHHKSTLSIKEQLLKITHLQESTGREADAEKLFSDLMLRINISKRMLEIDFPLSKVSPPINPGKMATNPALFLGMRDCADKIIELQ